MGLFGSKEKKGEAELPTLPKLPRLPALPDTEDKEITQLPSFPMSSFGKKFSQNSIKDAVSGEKGGKDFYANDFSDDDMRMMQEPLRKPKTEEVEDDIEEEAPKNESKVRVSFREGGEPVFVRIDKFEEGLRIFEDVKNQISEIERGLSETKRLKEKEDAELHSWEDELKRMKGEIEKIGNDIFSKI